MATQINDDQSMPLRELVRKGIPVLSRTAKAMQEHERLSGSVLFIIHLNIVDLNGMPARGCLFGSVRRSHGCISHMSNKVNSGLTGPWK
jgi:hypothetical protein